jgi:hypothetical protein
MLTLRPTPSEPVRVAPGRAELVATWDALDQDGRRLLLAQARAWVAVTGRAPPALRADLPVQQTSEDPAQ